MQVSYTASVEDIKRQYGHKLKDMKSDLNDLINAGLFNPSYSIDLSRECPTISSGQNKWDPAKRYSDDSIWQQAASDAYQRELAQVMSMISKMKADGII